MSIATLLRCPAYLRRSSLAMKLFFVVASAALASPLAAQEIITATVATNVIDADENGSGDSAGDPAGVPGLGSAAVNAVTSVGTRRFHIEWDLAGVIGPVPSAQVQLTTDPGAGSFSLDTLFYAGNATGNGTIEFGDFETAATQIGSVTLPQSESGLFLFDVTDELNAALAGGFSFFVVQGRVANEAALQGGNTFDRGSQIYTTCTSCAHTTADMPQLLINRDVRAQFAATKDFTDGNPNDVTVQLNCFTGLPLQQEIVISESDGDPAVVFVVESFDSGELDCTLSEDPLPGYETSYSASGDSGGSGETQGCVFTDVSLGDENACLITNTPAPVDVVITKEWLFENSTETDIDTYYKLTLYCDAEIVDGYESGTDTLVEGPAGGGCGFLVLAEAPAGPSGQWCKSFSGDSSDTFTAQVIPDYPSSHCYVDERVYDSAVEVDNDCNDIVVSAGNGDECTITNTVFFEGIPALSPYGLAVLALLMLGVGFVVMRRIL